MTGGERARAEIYAFWISAGIHAAVILVLLAGYLLSLWRQTSRPREIVTYIDLATAPLDINRPSDLPALLPSLPRPPSPSPTPSPPVRPPSPSAPKPAPATPAPQTRAPTPPSPRRPDTTPQQPQRARPALTADHIREQLADALRSPRDASAASRVEDDFPFGWYFAYVRQALYEAWTQPSGLSASSGLSVLARIRVERDGRITQREIVRPSGHAAMDESVRRALDTVQRLRPLPEAYKKPYRDITIAFELTDTTI